MDKRSAELFALITEAMGAFSHDMYAIRNDTEGPYTEDLYQNLADAMRKVFEEAHP